MGAGAWSPSTYAATTTRKITTGTSFGYSSSMSSAAPSARKVHDDLDPKKVAGPTSPMAGKVVREARDNDEHPTSLGIALIFDETGSMGNTPRVLQGKLGAVHGLLQRKGYVEHPQILMGAYGDAHTHEPAPLQVGQFESDNRGDDDLDKIYLVGNGGGNNGESAALAWYYMGRAAELDSLDKRGKKGYLATIGDEVPLNVTKDEVDRVIGDYTDFEGDLTPAQALAYAQKKFNVFHVLIRTFASEMQNSQKVYTDLLGVENVIVLENEDNVAEAIASYIGLKEGTVDLDEALDNLDDVGAGSARASLSKALAKVRGSGKGNVVKGNAPVTLTGAKPASRL
jgi:hypothetical protein